MSFVDQFAKFGDAVALVDSHTNNKISYKELLAKIDEFITQLPSLKSFIAIECQNNIETIVAYLACLKSGHVAFMYDALMDEGIKKTIMKEYTPDLVYYLGQDGKYILQDNISGKKINQSLALCLSTSGSTGSPKLVRLSLKNVMENTRSIVSYLELTKSEVAITSLPLHYSYGLSILNTHLSVGAKIILTNNSILSREFWDAFKLNKVTSLSGVPYHYEMLDKIRFFRMALPSLRVMTQAGGKLNEVLVEKFSEHAYENKIKFFVMYGQTEATARISYMPPEKILKNTGSIGKAIPGGKLMLEDDKGDEIKTAGVSGELVYKGPNVMLGYAYDRSDLAKGDEQDGCLKTGDIACKDENGFFSIKGRLNRFIKLQGNRFGLDELEVHLKKQCLDCICGGSDDRLVVLTEKEDIVQRIEEALKDTFKLHYTTFKVLFCEKYPISSSGKVCYKSLEENLL